MEVVVYNPMLNSFKQGNIVSWARANKLDLVVENHRNSAGETSHGYESLIDHYQTVTNSIKEVHKAMVALGWRDRGFVKRNGPGQKGHQNSRLMRIAKIPYVLLEHGFISNPKENQKYDSLILAIGSGIYDAAEKSGVKRLGVIYGHGEGDPGACKLPRTEADDVRKIKIKGEIELTEKQIRAIVKDEVGDIIREEVRNALKPSEIDTAGQEPSHWAEGAFQNLQGQGIKFHERRFDDAITRGEVFQITSNVLGSVKNK